MSVTAQKLAFSCANTAAVLVALYVAFANNLERPYWAMFSVFVIAKPISGAVRSKAVYRLVGTLAGAAMALFLVPPLVQAPSLLCLAISSWVGVCLYFSALDRTPRSYAFMLAGYTATIVGFSVVNAPQAIFDTAVARTEEIGLGIICGAVAHSVIFPQSVTDELNRRIRSVIRACAQWIGESPPHHGQPVDLSAQQRLATAVSESHLLYAHVAFETSDAPRARPIVQALEVRIAVLLPRISGVQRALAALATVEPPSAELATLIAQVSRWARALARQDESFVHSVAAENALQDACTAAMEMLERTPGRWPTLLEHAAIVDLSELTRALADCERLCAALESQKPRPPAAFARQAARSGSRAFSADRGLAARSAIAAACATLLACVLWIGGSWPQGLVAAQFAAIGASLFARLDDPAEPILPAVGGILLAVPIAAAYEFALFPRIDGFAPLALVLTPVLFLLSLMQTYERLEGVALVLAIAFCGALALEPSYQADFAAFLNVNAAEIIGLLVAGATVLVLRTIDPLSSARRLSRAGRQSLARLARGAQPSFELWLVQMFDRLGLIATRLLAARQAGTAHTESDPLRDLRVGLRIQSLRQITHAPGSSNRQALEAVLAAVARAYEERNERHSGTASADLAKHIDAGLAAIKAQPPSADRREAMAALTGLRLDLLPGETPYFVEPSPA